MQVKKYGWTIQKSLYAYPTQDFILCHTCKNSKIFNKTSKCFIHFSNKTPASWVAHITNNFLTCYSCCYYSFVNIVTHYRILLRLVSKKQWESCQSQISGMEIVNGLQYFYLKYYLSTLKVGTGNTFVCQ